MKKGRSVPLLLLICFTACTASELRNTNCLWPQETIRPLDLQSSTDRRHLGDDALVAEDLAIRYADAHRGHRSGQFQGAHAYAQLRIVASNGLMF